MTTAKTTTKTDETLNIYQIVSRIGEEAGNLKAERSAQGGVPFAFRGVDAVVNHLTPFLRKYGVITVPAVRNVLTSTRELAAGKAITQSEVITDYTFFAPDGTSITATTTGLAQDYSDRSAAQAQSVAFRVALLQTFTLPTDAQEPEEAGEQTQKYIADTGAKEVKPAAEVVATNATQDLAIIKGEVQKLAKAQGITTIVKLREYGDNFFGVDKDNPADPKAKWLTTIPALEKLKKHLESGEVA